MAQQVLLALAAVVILGQTVWRVLGRKKAGKPGS
jgi:hypothetical protein